MFLIKQELEHHRQSSVWRLYVASFSLEHLLCHEVQTSVKYQTVDRKPRILAASPSHRLLNRIILLKVMSMMLM